MYDLRRYEIKFLIEPAVKSRILEAGQEVLSTDPHAVDGVYRVTSQYYDTVDLRSYWEKLDGVDPRRKFRLRFYGEKADSETSYFMEIKYRIDQTIFKERLKMTPESALNFLDEATPLEALDECCRADSDGEREILANFVFACREMLLPSNVISYLREAWVGAVDDRLRLTFDHLACGLDRGQFLAALEGRGQPLFAQNQVLMEVKFSHRIPIWLRDILTKEKLTPIRFSKYATGVEKLRDWPHRKRLGLVGRGLG